ncbi:MAG: excinuclease ABC subunit UvrB [Clostridia bacterium]|nr:excinuclease ABC subunit UvrB [Clostridia bacterium]MBT7122407.1 excinuclease ABC subunit UvrB [Clostridia bacterium]
MLDFKLQANYKPAGSQPDAIDALVAGIESGKQSQVLLGVTGSGKTFTAANVIERLNRPTLVLAHNKTLAAQLCGEFREYFPDNAVEFFVSYYDYYQPEAYIPGRDLYIEKDASINDEIDRLRHSATLSLLERRDVIVVASVSCIYSIGSPEEYRNMKLSLRPGMIMPRDRVIEQLVDINYTRSDMNFERGCFRVRGDTVEIFPANTFEKAVRIEFFGDEIERILEIEIVTGKALSTREHIIVFPASHYVIERESMLHKLDDIKRDMMFQIEYFKKQGKLLEAERIKQRTVYDMEMMRELGYCSGIENYARYFDGRKPGDPPYTLLDFFPDDALLFVDESHVMLPQVRAMYKGDFSRKDMLVQYGFRLPSAYDNRPLKFEEFKERQMTTVFVSATPAVYERDLAGEVVEQIVRPTGLLDPQITVFPAKGQVEHLLGEIRATVKQDACVLVTTLTKKMAERLTDYYKELGVRVKYMHSDIDTLERMNIIRQLRMREFDVLVGINLLREGLDLPEVSLVAVLDADKEGFLRNETSLIQTIGRASRNSEGRVLLYADKMTGSMERAMSETQRRRAMQIAYNEEHGITPQSIIKETRSMLEITKPVKDVKQISRKDARKKAYIIEKQMKQAAMELEFETATILRDELIKLKEIIREGNQ